MPQHSSVTPIAEDIYQVQLPLPFALRIVNCYLLRGPHGWTLVDSGLNTAEGRETWRQAFSTLGIGPADLEKIVLTHVHPDHFGMVGWLQGLAAEAGRTLPVYTSPREEQQARQVWWGNTLDQFYSYLVAGGMPPPMAREVADGMTSTRDMTLPHPPALDTIQPGSTLTLGGREFRSIHAPGHSDGQLLFYDADDRLLLSGDHVLMKITPNIGLWSNSDPDPLGNFMQSLAALQKLDVRLALPGHKGLITDWCGRLQELIEHHQQRLEHTLEALADTDGTVYATAQRVFSIEHFTMHEWRFAIAETLAHLEYLRVRGQVTQQAGPPVLRFALS